MKQLVLLIIAFFILITVYSVIIGIQDQSDTTRPSSASKAVLEKNITKESVITKAVETKPEVVKQHPKAPPITKASKRLFLKKTTEAILKVKSALDAEYQTVYDLSLKSTLTPEEHARLDKLKKKYHFESTDALLQRLKTHPVSIVIAQAALETGWGSSRFYREANNIFGVWSFNKNEPRIAAGVQREGQKTIYVKKYPNLEASIAGYFRMISRGRAYKAFRKARLESDNPFELIPYLDHYSELRHEYVKRLYYVIKSNKFYELDNPVYQPPGWSNIKAADPKYLLAPKELNTTKDESNTTQTGPEINATLENNSTTIESNSSVEDTNATSIDVNLTEAPHALKDPPFNEIIKDEVNTTQEENLTLKSSDLNESQKVPEPALQKDLNASSTSLTQELNSSL